MTDWPEAYLLSGQHRIEGWVQRDALLLTLALHRLQRAAGEGGAVAEIGVHHGRLFLALALLRDPTEAAIAIDVFDRQDLNPDGSGRGDRAIFTANLAAWQAAERTHVLARDSLDLHPRELRALAGPGGVRLFSVDGAHALGHVLNDLRLAEACLAPGGVILLDDLFHPDWPEVTEAAIRHLGGGAAQTRPLAICGGKLFLARQEDHAGWRARLEARVQRYAAEWKEVRLCDTACLAIRFPPRDGLFGQVGRPTRAQRLGAAAALDFQGRGPDPALLGPGWGKQEDWGRLTDGPEAQCSVPLPPGLVPRALVVDCGVPDQPDAAEMLLGLEVAGRALPPLVLRGPATGPRQVVLPALPAGEALAILLRPGAGRVAVLALGVSG